MASAATGRTVRVFLDGADLGSFAVPSGGWQAFQNVTVPVSNMSNANPIHRVRVVFTNGDVNLNYIDFP